MQNSIIKNHSRNADSIIDINKEQKDFLQKKRYNFGELDLEAKNLNIEICAICNEYEIFKFKLIKCSKCFINVHAKCYKNLKELDNDKDIKTSFSDWFCDKCNIVNEENPNENILY